MIPSALRATATPAESDRPRGRTRARAEWGRRRLRPSCAGVAQRGRASVVEIENVRPHGCIAASRSRSLRHSCAPVRPCPCRAGPASAARERPQRTLTQACARERPSRGPEITTLMSSGAAQTTHLDSSPGSGLHIFGHKRSRSATPPQQCCAASNSPILCLTKCRLTLQPRSPPGSAGRRFSTRFN